MITMKSFEYNKDFICVFLFKPDPIVGNNDPAFIHVGHPVQINLNMRNASFFTKLDGIADEVLKQLPKLARNSPDAWKSIYLYACICLFNFHFKVGKHTR